VGFPFTFEHLISVHLLGFIDVFASVGHTASHAESLAKRTGGYIYEINFLNKNHK